MEILCSGEAKELLYFIRQVSMLRSSSSKFYRDRSRYSGSCNYYTTQNDAAMVAGATSTADAGSNTTIVAAECSTIAPALLITPLFRFAWGSVCTPQRRCRTRYSMRFTLERPVLLSMKVPCKQFAIAEHSRYWLLLTSDTCVIMAYKPLLARDGLIPNTVALTS